MNKFHGPMIRRPGMIANAGRPPRTPPPPHGQDRPPAPPSERPAAWGHLRAPDPVLAVLDERVVLSRSQAGTTLVAHRESRVPPDVRPIAACGTGNFGLPCLMARDVAYTAVPCRECFPEAPEPGDPQPCDLCIEGGPHVRSGLAWQAG